MAQVNPTTNAQYFTFHASQLIEGWPTEDIDAIDFDATTQRIYQILRSVVGDVCQIEVLWEDGKDRLEGDWADHREEAAIKEELANLPWHDFQRWGVGK
jgi:hypothetical protein